MTIRRTSVCAFVATIMLFVAGGNFAAQAADDSQRLDKGFTLWERYQGSSNSLGQVTKLDTTAGYKFNKHFALEGGIPIYFVRASATSTTTSSNTQTGIGNAYIDLRMVATGSAMSFVSTLTGTAPTGDTDSGLSTGRATVDWNNYFGYKLGRITPFADLGIANSISDTHFFTRPFTSLGKVGHFEAGSEFELWRSLSAGTSYYVDSPFGQQKVFSKVVKGQRSAVTTSNPGSGSTRGGRQGIFETQSAAVGSADILGDNGFSFWIGAIPKPFLNLELGYSRSVEYAFNTVSFSVGFNLGYLTRRGERP